MLRSSIVLASLLGGAVLAPAQQPLRHFSDGIEARFDRTQPVVHYLLRVRDADLSSFEVEIRLRNVRDTFQLAMVAHPEYDDRYWRFVDDLRAEPAGAVIVPTDSALWRVTTTNGTATIRYRVRLPVSPPGPRAAWRPFLAPTGGLVGGTHAFMYVVGASLAPSHVTLDLPTAWEIATGLEPTADPHTFFASTVHTLVEAPMLVGRFRSWRFAIDGVPHRVVYWPLPNATPFDTTRFVTGIERLVHEAVGVFGRAPWREYDFLFQDGAVGALEHPNSVTIGARSASLAENPDGLLGETAHEFFHAWNLMRIRPAEYRDVDYRRGPYASGLWFSEGLSMFYSDLLRRRAELPTGDSSRTQHLSTLIARYLGFPGNTHLSAEAVSRAAYVPTPGALGDYENASTHVQGELLGAMIDLAIRDATNGRRSLDDLMRLMLERFSGEHGFTSTDVERAVADVCGCSVHSLFESSVRGAAPIDVDRFLRLIGLRAQIAWRPSLDRDGKPVPDLRFYAWLPSGEERLRLLVTDPEGVWGRSGLHTGDRLRALNGAPVPDASAFRTLISRAQIGDTLRFEIERARGPLRTSVVVRGYERPVVSLVEIPDATARQRALRDQWMRSR